MKTTEKPLFDSNILIYSVNADSPFHETALELLVQYTQSGFYVADVNLIEFFQVVTDGRKTVHPFSTEQASEYIRKLVNIPQVSVLRVRSLHEILQDDEAHEEVRRLKIKRFAIYDYLIADCMRRHNVKEIITGNARDFRKFPFLDVINPFTNYRTSDSRHADTPIHPYTHTPILPYGRQSISEQDVAAVCSVLCSDFLTQGPKVPEFEKSVTDYCGAKHAVAVNSATSALHIACLALGLGPGDILWTTPITFVASANCALYCGAEVDFVDIDPATYNMSLQALEQKLGQARKAGKTPKIVVPVHMCGQPCDMKAVSALSQEYGFHVIEDASHAIGGRYKGEPIGNCRYSDITVFSFHPVKIITTGEGGMAMTNNPELAKRMQLLRNHGITRDAGKYGSKGVWECGSGKMCGSKGVWESGSKDMGTSKHPYSHTSIPPYANTPKHPYVDTPKPAYYYEQINLGFNYRMTDIQAALGISQIKRLDEFVSRRRELAQRYDRLLGNLPLKTPWQHPDGNSAWHLYVIRLGLEKTSLDRRQVFEYLRENGIGVNVHYIPVHTQPYYQAMGFDWGMFPEAEKYYPAALTLPLFPTMREGDQDRVVEALKRILPTEHTEGHGK
jgi:dTDP-4-amino-4,6-dideoxygalactose transaminase/predicted nucleic acid-binding protein